MYLLLLVLPGTARYCQVLLLQVLDCRYWYCWYVILLVVGVVGVHGCIISHMYTPHFILSSCASTHSDQRHLRCESSDIRASDHRRGVQRNTTDTMESSLAPPQHNMVSSSEFRSSIQKARATEAGARTHS